MSVKTKLILPILKQIMEVRVMQVNSLKTKELLKKTTITYSFKNSKSWSLKEVLDCSVQLDVIVWRHQRLIIKGSMRVVNQQGNQEGKLAIVNSNQSSLNFQK